MNIQELRKHGPITRFLAINEYLMCGLKYRFGRIDKIQPAVHARRSDIWKVDSQGL